MKLIKKLSPKRLFQSMKSRSEPSSFSSGATYSSSDEESSLKKARANGTPVSVLPQMSGEWSDGGHNTSLELYQAFKLIDHDNDGTISRAELEALLNRIGSESMSRDEMAVMLREVGCYDDDDSCLNIEDLVGRVGSVCGPAGDSELRETFDFFDRDHDGRITAEELLKVFMALGDDECTLEDCRRMIADVDKNRDGVVCFEDFARMMEQQI